MVRACERHLPPKVCSWDVPTGGMFLWIRLNVDECRTSMLPDDFTDPTNSVREVENRIYIEAMANGVLVSKGSWFATPDIEPSNVYFRITFAAAPEDAIEEAIERFSCAVQIAIRS